jgi:hypothetical protein
LNNPYSKKIRPRLKKIKEIIKHLLSFLILSPNIYPIEYLIIITKKEKKESAGDHPLQF